MSPSQTRYLVSQEPRLTLTSVLLCYVSGGVSGLFIERRDAVGVREDECKKVKALPEVPMHPHKLLLGVC